MTSTNDISLFPGNFLLLYTVLLWKNITALGGVAIGVFATSFCNIKVCHGRWLEFWGNFPYPGGYCSSSNTTSLIIFHNQLTRGGTQPENSWWCCHHHPPCRYCLVPRVSWPCIFTDQMLIWMPQTFGSRLWQVHLALVVRIKFPKQTYLQNNIHQMWGQLKMSTYLYS